MVVLGGPSDSEIARAFDADLIDGVIRQVQCAVHVVPTASDLLLRVAQSAAR
jgi:hypothetical protein